MPFTSTNQPKGRGRPKGSKNKASLIDQSLQTEAFKQLQIAIQNGEQWAIQAVLDRCYPKLKQITPVQSLDGEYLQLKAKEISEFEQRLQVLEGLQ